MSKDLQNGDKERTSSKKIAFVRSHDLRTERERHVCWGKEYVPVRTHCKKSNIEVNEEVWDDPDVDWTQYDLVVPKSVWDYVTKVDKFIEWLDSLEKQGVKTVNSLKLIKWNLDKTYMLDLVKEGIPIADFVVVEKGTTAPNLTKLMEDKNWVGMAMKPTVGARNYKARFLYSTEEAELFQEPFENDLVEHSYILQRFVKGITIHGEWSVVYFGRQMSHVAKKKVELATLQTMQQGIEIIESPDEEIVKFADNVMGVIHSIDPPVYTRVDILKDEDGQLLLGEVELLEPCLHFHQENMDAPKTFAEALAEQF